MSANPTTRSLADPEAEAAVCRWLCNGEALDRLDALTPALFTLPETVMVFGAVIELTAEGIEPAPTEVIQRCCIDREAPPELRPLILGLTRRADIPPEPAAVERQIQRLTDHHRRRELIRLGSRLTAPPPNLTTDQMAEEAREALAGIDALGARPDGLAAILDAWAARYEEMATGAVEPGIATGICCLDNDTGGIRPGELWLVGGATSSGKTALAGEITVNLLDAGRAVMLASAEMTTADVITRLLCTKSRTPLPVLRDPARHTPGKHDLRAIMRALEAAAGWRLLITETCALDGILALARAARRRDGLDLLVIDYAQLLDVGGEFQSREREVASISRALKLFAKAEGTAALLLTQLNDDGRTRESRQLAMDADTVLVIEADGIRLRKQRNGPAGHLLPLILDGPHQRFADHGTATDAA